MQMTKEMMSLNTGGKPVEIIDHIRPVPRPEKTPMTDAEIAKAFRDLPTLNMRERK